MAIKWKCPNCELVVIVPDSAIPPVRCRCGHIDHNPQFSSPPTPRPVQYIPAEPEDNGLWLALVHSLWRELHMMAFTDFENIESRYTDWLPRVPSFGCACSSHWKSITEATPPDFSSPEVFFAWTVARHNEVNERLNKPIVSLEDARKLYETV